jgi:hypothetical protein
MRLAGGAAAQSCGGTADSAGGMSARLGEPLHVTAEAALRDAPPDAAAGAGYDAAATAAAAVHFALFGAPYAALNAAQLPPAPLDGTRESVDAYMRACAARLGRLEAETASAEVERAGAGAAPADAAAHPHAAGWLSASSGEASADESDMSEPGADRSMPEVGDDGAAAASTHATDSDGSCSSGAGAAPA